MRRALVVALPLVLATVPAAAEPADDPALLLRLVPVPVEERPAAVLDWYPGTSGFRVTGGRQNAGRRNGFAPYIGLGWQGSLLDGRVLIGLDFGALYQGRPDVRMLAHQEALAPEPEHQDDTPFKPFISLNLVYRF
ncbi:MAG TPA: hypothetical protein VLL76_09430 [Candidatus Omnitrophota bacterium]|nr:hypothetical protein [Candidatus Omnitrophota bacterium]